MPTAFPVSAQNSNRNGCAVISFMFSKIPGKPPSAYGAISTASQSTNTAPMPAMIQAVNVFFPLIF